MALRDQPYLPLYVQDYLTDEKLNLCSLKTQGVYVKIMCVLHKQKSYGVLLLKQKEKQNQSIYLNFALKFAKLLPIHYDDLHDAIVELVEEDVMTIDGDALIQGRMVKDNDISEKRANAGSKGGKQTQTFAKAKSKAKIQANPEDESEYEDDNEIKRKKKDEIKIVTMPFTTKNFSEKWEQWKQYKKDEHNFTYKTASSEQAALIRLAKKSIGREETAIDIILESMSNKWQGLFELEDKKNTKNNEDNQTQRIAKKFINQS